MVTEEYSSTLTYLQGVILLNLTHLFHIVDSDAYQYFALLYIVLVLVDDVNVVEVV